MRRELKNILWVTRYIILGAAREIFTLKKLAMPNVAYAPRKKRQDASASCSVIFHYLHPSKLISDWYSKKYKRDALSGIIIARRDFIIVTRREQLYIFMKHQDLGDHELHCVHNWVRFIREGSDAHTY